MDQQEHSAAEVNTYRPRRSVMGRKKPIKFPGGTAIKGAPRLRATIERLCPNDGNRRRESLLLTAAWQANFPRAAAEKSLIIALAARALQQSKHAFADQVRKNGDTVSGIARAKCTCAKTCHWMIEQGLFVVVAPPKSH
jgi:hypothetical protein